MSRSPESHYDIACRTSRNAPQKCIGLFSIAILFLCFPLGLGSARGSVPPFSGSLGAHQSSPKSANSGVGFQFSPADLITNSAFDLQAAVITNVAYATSGAPWGGHGIDVQDQISALLPITVSRSGYYDIDVKCTVNGALYAVGYSALLAANKGVFAVDLELGITTASGAIVSDSIGEDRSIYSTDFSVVALLTDATWTALDTATQAVELFYSGGAGNAVTLYTHWLDAIQAVENYTPVKLFSNEQYTLSARAYLEAGQNYRWVLASKTQCSSLTAGLGGNLSYSKVIVTIADVSVTEPSGTVTVQPSPTGKGLQITVDGTNYTDTHAFNWSDNSEHTLQAPQTQTGNDGKVYAFQGWGDGYSGSLRSVTAHAGDEYTAIYTTSATLNTGTFTASADTDVRAQSPTENDGCADFLFVFTDKVAGGRIDSLLEFDVRSIPSGSVVQSVELNLTLIPQTIVRSDVFEVDEVTSPWSAGNCVSGSGVDWNHRPSSGNMLALLFAQSSSVSVNSSDYPPLTDTVQSWVNSPSQNYGFYLVDNSGTNGIGFYSREDSTASHRPNLIVTYTLPPSPTPPNNLSATPVSASGINLSWSDNSNNETTFRIERSSDGVTFTEIDSVGSGVTSYAVTGLTPCSTYYFRVRARNAGGDSGYTNVASAKTLGCQAPVLSVSTTSISQTITQGQTAVSQSFEVWNSGTGSMSFTVIVDQPWLSVSPTSASSSGENQTIQVTYNPSGLAAGQTYSATITVSATGAAGSPQQITVWYTVIGAPCVTLPTPTPNCVMTLTTTTVTLSWGDVGDESGYELAVYGGGGCVGSPLIHLQLPADTTSCTVTVPSAGSYSWRVRAKGNGMTYCDSGWSSCCSVTVPPTPQPILSLSPSSLSQTVTQGQNLPSQSFEVWNSGSGLLNYTITTNAAWLSVRPTSGVSSGATNTHTVTYNTAGLAAGSYGATLTVSPTNTNNSPQTISVSLSVTATNNPLAKVAIVNPDNYRILKYGRLTGDGYFYLLANATLADNVNGTTNAAWWTGLGTSPDYLTTILTNAGYQVDVYTGTNFPSVTLNDYQLVIVQDPMTDITQQFSADAAYNGADLLQYTTNATFLSRLDSYFNAGGSVILVGDAVRLLENGTGRLNYGKTIVADNATNSVTTPSSLIPSQWLFIRGAPFCCVDRSGGGSNTVVQSSLVAIGAVVSQVSLFDGNDSSYCEVWSETVYYPSDAVSLLDVRFQGAGQYVIDGSTCSPTIYQDTVSQVTSNLMGYTTFAGRKIFFLGSDSFFDLQSLSLQGNWHCSSAPNSQTIDCQITANGVNAILNLVAMAIGRCTYSLSTDKANFSDEGGSGNVTLTANGTTCPWTATSNDSFITITGGTNGTGNGTVSYTVAANSGASGAARTGTMTIAGQTFTVDQIGAGPVKYSFSSVVQKCKTKINKKTGATNTTCTVAFNLVVTNTGATTTSRSSVLFWLGQGSTFNPNTTGTPAPLTKTVKALKANKSVTIKVKSKKLNGDQAGTFIFASDNENNVLAFAQVPNP